MFVKKDSLVEAFGLERGVDEKESLSSRNFFISLCKDNIIKSRTQIVS